MGIPEYEAKRYEGRIKDGGILLSVHCDTPSWIKRAEDLLKATGAEDIASGTEAAATLGATSETVRRAFKVPRNVPAARPVPRRSRLPCVLSH
jgi:hypothetical protein